MFRQMVADVAKLRGGDHAFARLQLDEKRLKITRDKQLFAPLDRSPTKTKPTRHKPPGESDSAPSEAELAELLRILTNPSVKVSQGESR